MVSKAIPLLLLLLPFLSAIKPSSAASGINITAILEKYPDYQYHLSFLQQANLTDQINQLDAMTILAFKEPVIDQFVKHEIDGNGTFRILETQVLLDYIDDARMNAATTDKPVTFTSLFQTYGKAPGVMGMVKMQKGSDGKVVFGSAVPGAPMNTHVVSTVVALPPKVSVLEIDNIIVPPGLMKLPLPDGTPAWKPPPMPPPYEVDPPTPSVSPSQTADADATSPAAADAAPIASATIAPVVAVVRNTVAPKASASAPAAGSPKGSEPSSATSTAPTGEAAGSPDSGVAGGPAAGGPTTTTTTMAADGPTGADGPGPAAASGGGRVMVRAGVGMGIVGMIMMSV